MNEEKLDIFGLYTSGQLNGLSPEGVYDVVLAQGKDFTLTSPEDYKKIDQVKKIYTDNAGKFNEAAFKKDYDESAKIFNKMSEAQTEVSFAETLNKGYAMNESTVADYSGAEVMNNQMRGVSRKPTLKDLPLLQGADYGMTLIGEWSKPKLSINELRQNNNKIFDGESGKFIPNWTKEMFAGGKSFTENLYEAVYHDDVKDNAGNVIHRKGEIKLDDDGLPYFETLKKDVRSEDVSHLQASFWDIMTPENSIINKVDFMDSDDLDKTYAGTIFKTAAQIGTYFIPYVGQGYALAVLGGNLLNVGATLAKSGMEAGGFGKGSSAEKFLNETQKQLNKFKVGTSEAGKEDFFSLESLGSMVVQSFDTLFTGSTLVKGFGKLPLIGKTVKNPLMQKSIASTYWSGIAVGDIKNEMSQLGIANEKDQSLMTLGAWIGMSALIAASPIDNLIMQELSESATAGRKTLKDFVKNELLSSFDEINKLGGGEKEKKLLEKGKEAGARYVKGIYDYFKSPDKNVIVQTALGEGLEEVSEEAVLMGMKSVYNGLADAGLVNQKKKDNKQPKFKFDNIYEQLGQSFFGGMVGGAVFGGVKYKNQQDSNSDYTIEGFIYEDKGNADVLREQVESLRKQGSFGSTKLSTILSEDNQYFKPASKTEISQNDFIAKKLNSIIDATEKVMYSENIEDLKTIFEKYNEQFKGVTDAKDLQKFINAKLVESKYSTLIAKDFKASVDELLGKRKEWIDMTQKFGDVEPSESALTSNKVKLDKLKEDIGNIRERIQNIQDGKIGDYYYQQALFFSRPYDLVANFAIIYDKNGNKKSGVKSINDFLPEDYNTLKNKIIKEIELSESAETEEEKKAHHDKAIEFKNILENGRKLFSQYKASPTYLDHLYQAFQAYSNLTKDVKPFESLKKEKTNLGLIEDFFDLDKNKTEINQLIKDFDELKTEEDYKAYIDKFKEVDSFYDYDDTDIDSYALINNSLHLSNILDRLPDELTLENFEDVLIDNNFFFARFLKAKGQIPALYELYEKAKKLNPYTFDDIEEVYFNLLKTKTDNPSAYVNTSYLANINNALSLMYNRLGLLEASFDNHRLVNTYKKENKNVINKEELITVEDAKVYISAKADLLNKIKELEVLQQEIKSKLSNFLPELKKQSVSNFKVFTNVLLLHPDIKGNTEILNKINELNVILDDFKGEDYLPIYTKMRDIEDAVYDLVSRTGNVSQNIEDFLAKLPLAFDPNNFEIFSNKIKINENGSLVYNDYMKFRYLESVLKSKSSEFYNKLAELYETQGVPALVYPQENVLKMAYAFLDNDVDYFSKIHAKDNKVFGRNFVNGIFTILGVGGAGKTFLTQFLANKYGMEKVLYFAPKEEQLEGLSKNLDDKDVKRGKTYSEIFSFFNRKSELDKVITEVLGDYKDFKPTDKIHIGNFASLSKIDDFVSNITDLKEFGKDFEGKSLIILDEATHLDFVSLYAFNKLIKQYVALKQKTTDKTFTLRVITLGDSSQRGYMKTPEGDDKFKRQESANIGGSDFLSIHSPYIANSIRGQYDVIRNAVDNLSTAVSKANIATTNRKTGAIPLELEYFESTTNLIYGFKMVEGDLKERLAEFERMVSSIPGATAVIISDDLSLTSSKIPTLTPKQVQGREYDYVFYYPTEISDDVFTQMTNLNTDLLRAKQGLMFYTTPETKNKLKPVVTITQVKKEVLPNTINPFVTDKIKEEYQKFYTDLMKGLKTGASKPASPISVKVDESGLVKLDLKKGEGIYSNYQKSEDEIQGVDYNEPYLEFFSFYVRDGELLNFSYLTSSKSSIKTEAKKNEKINLLYKFKKRLEASKDLSIVEGGVTYTITRFKLKYKKFEDSDKAINASAKDEFQLKDGEGFYYLEATISAKKANGETKEVSILWAVAPNIENMRDAHKRNNNKKLGETIQLYEKVLKSPTAEIDIDRETYKKHRFFSNQKMRFEEGGKPFSLSFEEFKKRTSEATVVISEPYVITGNNKNYSGYPSSVKNDLANFLEENKGSTIFFASHLEYTPDKLLIQYLLEQQDKNLPKTVYLFFAKSKKIELSELLGKIPDLKKKYEKLKPFFYNIIGGNNLPIIANKFKEISDNSKSLGESELIKKIKEYLTTRDVKFSNGTTKTLPALNLDNILVDDNSILEFFAFLENIKTKFDGVEFNTPIMILNSKAKDMADVLKDNDQKDYLAKVDDDSKRDLLFNYTLDMPLIRFNFDFLFGGGVQKANEELIIDNNEKFINFVTSEPTLVNQIKAIFGSPETLSFKQISTFYNTLRGNKNVDSKYIDKLFTNLEELIKVICEGIINKK